MLAVVRGVMEVWVGVKVSMGMPKVQLEPQHFLAPNTTTPPHTPLPLLLLLLLLHHYRLPPRRRRRRLLLLLLAPQEQQATAPTSQGTECYLLTGR